MIEVILSVFLFILGACLGSFVVAQVWRLRARQLTDDKKAKRKYDKSEYSQLKQLVGRKAKDDRSICLHCHRQLEWFDMLPVVSWLALSGKCRKCRQAIGKLEFVTEVLLGVAFVVAYWVLQPQTGGAIAIAYFAVWLVFLAVLTLLFIYDLKWSLMPSKVLYFSVFCAIILLICNILQGGFGAAQIPGFLVSLAVLPGLYLALFLVSRGSWVGSGDYILALALVLVVQDALLALIALFLSNLLGCLVFVWSTLSKKQPRLAKMPFGPLLIAGCLIVLLLKDTISQVLFI